MINVSFSGLDGAGKSTQVDLLEQWLKSKGLSVKRIHLFSPSQSVMSKSHDMTIIIKIIKFLRSNSKIAFIGFILGVLRIINVSIDSLLTDIKLKKTSYDVIIFDRYFYDVLVFIIRDIKLLKPLALFITKFIVPKPDVVFFFSAADEVLTIRRSEHSLDEVQRNKSCFNSIFNVISHTPVDGELNQQDIHQKIKLSLAELVKDNAKI